MSYTSTQTTTFPGTTGSTVQNSYNNAIGTYDNTPYTPYTGTLVAGQNSIQNQAVNNEQGLGAYQPMMTTPGSVFNNSGGGATTLQGLGSYTPINVGGGVNVTQFAGGTGAGSLSTNGMNLSGYENPYTSQVINTSLQQLNNQLATTDNASDAAATTAGAFGGDRAAIVNAQNAYNTNQIAAQTIAGLNSSNYTNAETQAQTDLSREATAGTSQAGLSLQAQQANQSADLAGAGLRDTSANQLLGAGVQQTQLGLQSGQGNQFAGLQAANLQNTVNNSAFNMGTQFQNTSQANDTAAYQQFQNGIQWPLQMQGLAGTATQQYAPALLDNATTTAVTPAGSTAAQIVGGLTAGASLLGAVGNSSNGISSLYNNLFGSGSSTGAAGNTIDSVGNIENTTQSLSNGASDAASAAGSAGSGLFSWLGFKDGGRAGYADGGEVTDDDGTWLSADDEAADSRQAADGLGLAAAMMGGAATSGAGLGAMAHMPVGGGGLASAALPLGGGAGGVVTPGGGSNLGSSPDSIDPSQMVNLPPPPPSDPAWTGLMTGRGISANAVGSRYNPTVPDNGMSQVNVPLGLAGVAPPAAPVAAPGAAPAAGLGAVQQMTVHPDATDGSGGLAAAVASGDAGLPVPPIPPANPPAPGTQIAPAASSEPDGPPVPAGLPGAVSPRVQKSANPSAPLPVGPNAGPAPGSSMSTAPSASSTGPGLGSIQQPVPGTPGAPLGLAGAVQSGRSGTQSGNGAGNWLSNLYNQNPGAMALIKAGAAMMSSRDPHFGVALGQGLQAGANELDTIHESQQQQALRMATLANTRAYQEGMLNIRQQGQTNAANRTQIYAGAMDARAKLQAAQTEVANAKALNPTLTGATLQSKAIESLVAGGMSYDDAYMATKNYTETNAIKREGIQTRAETATAAQTALAAYRADLLKQQLALHNDSQLNATNRTNAGVTGKAAPLPTPVTGAPGGPVEGQTRTDVNGRPWRYTGGQWQPVQASAAPL